MKSVLKGLALAALFAVAAPAAYAQVNGSPIEADGPGLSAGREADIVKDQIKSFQSLQKSWPKFKAVSPEAQVAEMGAGINIIGGYDAYWTGGKSNFSAADIKRVKAAGFTHIRVPLFTFKHIVDTQGNLDPKWLEKLDNIVDLAIKNDLIVVLDEHDFEDCAKHVDECAALLAAVWYDLSERYKDAPNNVVFELLNEPNGGVDAEIWNAWVPDLISIIRETNPERNIIVGPVMWNSPSELDKLALPENDRHLIVTFHYYTPMTFTHQGATWAGPENQAAKDVRWTGTTAELAEINTTFDKVAAWSKAHKRPILLGEYGTYGAFNPNIEDRAAWTAAVSRAADARGFARAYWYYEDGNGFGVWDAGAKSWRKPLLKALLPNSAAAQ